MIDRRLRRQAPAFLQVPQERFQRADESRDGGVPATAVSAAERRRLETPEKGERGARRTALDADPRSSAKVRFCRVCVSGRSDRTRPRGRLRLVHGGLEARRPGRRRRQPRRRRRENARLGGFLRDGVQRGGCEEHAVGRVERSRACAFRQRDIAQRRDHERERTRGGEQRRAFRRVPVRVARRERALAEARSIRSRDGDSVFVRKIPSPLRRLGLRLQRVSEREVRRERARAKAPQLSVAERSLLVCHRVCLSSRRRRRRLDAASAAARLGARREVRQRLDIRRGFRRVAFVFRVQRGRAEPAPAQLVRRALAERRDDRLEVIREDPERAQRPGHHAPGAGEARGRASSLGGRRRGARQRSRRLVQRVDDEPRAGAHVLTGTPCVLTDVV